MKAGLGFFGTLLEWQNLECPLKDKLASVSFTPYLPVKSATVCQIHSNIVFKVDREYKSSSEGDGLYIGPSEAHMLGRIAVQTADCLPILGIDPVTRSRFTLHAGWRGLLSGIVESTLELIAKDGMKTEDYSIILGPCIGPRKFEVGEDVLSFALKHNTSLGEKEVYSHFTPLESGRDERVPQKFLLDLRSYALSILVSSGFKLQNVAVLDECTFEKEEWPSYRRDGREGIRTRKIYSSIE